MVTEADIQKMSLFSVARWCALIEGVNIIADHCGESNKDFDTIELEPLSLRKYVEGTCDSIHRMLEDKQKRKLVVIKPITIYDPIFEERLV